MLTRVVVAWLIVSQWIVTATAADPRDTRFPARPEIKPDQPWIGESRWQANQREVVLCGVLRDGPAGKAGLQANDAILEIAGRPVRTLTEYHAALEEHRPGESVEFAIRRDGRTRSVDVVLEQIPPDGGNGRILAAAEAGEGWAMMDIGVRYAGARGKLSYVDKNDDEAVRWFRRSADAGNQAGTMFLASMYQAGRGVPRDYARAAELYEQARNQSREHVAGAYGTSSSALASLHLQGLGVPQDELRAAQLYRQAADDGSLSAMVKLGDLYAAGRGVAQDPDLAQAWYQKAADLGYADAKAKLK